jgi:hypothetical protein
MDAEVAENRRRLGLPNESRELSTYQRRAAELRKAGKR